MKQKIFMVPQDAQAEESFKSPKIYCFISVKYLTKILKWSFLVSSSVNVALVV